MRKQIKRKEGLVERIKRFSKRELFKNKVVSMTLMLLGYISVPLLDNDITVFVILMMIALPVFFAKKNVIQ